MSLPTDADFLLWVRNLELGPNQFERDMARSNILHAWRELGMSAQKLRKQVEERAALHLVRDGESK